MHVEHKRTPSQKPVNFILVSFWVLFEDLWVEVNMKLKNDVQVQDQSFTGTSMLWLPSNAQHVDLWDLWAVVNW